MKHLSEEQLVLHYYRSCDDSATVEDHLASCTDCRQRLKNLELLLSAVDDTHMPARPVDYGQEVWRRLRPRLEERPRLSWHTLFEPVRLPVLPRWTLAFGAALLVVAAFVTGRFWPEPAASNTQWLGSGDEAVLKAELRREFDAKLQSEMFRVREQVAGAVVEIQLLRKDLETVVLEADNRLEHAQAQIGRLAALASPVVPDRDSDTLR